MRKNLLRGVGIFAAVLVGLELVLRLVFGLGNPPLYELSHSYGYRLKSNQDLVRFGNRIHINSYGMRSENISKKPQHGIIRILCVGDSTTYGTAQTDQKGTYPYFLEGFLNSTGRYEVLNASAPGWSLANEKAFVEENTILGSRFVILLLNDFDLFQKKEAAPNLKAYFQEKTVFAIQELITKYAPRYFRGKNQETKGVPHPQLVENRFNQLENNISLAKELSGFINNQGGQLLVFFMESPRNDETTSAIYQEARLRFQRALSEADIYYFNLSGIIGKNQAGELFYDGIHPNPEGNKIIAAAMADILLGTT